MRGSSNQITGGIFLGPVVQARRIGSVLLPQPTPTALAGLPSEQVFAGRESDLLALDSALSPSADDVGDAVIVSTVAGAAGVGKTALAIHAAHSALSQGWFT